MTQTQIQIDGVPHFCIIGETGIGKTRLAATIPNAYCLDTEGGAGSAFSKDYREHIPVGENLFSTVKTRVNEMLKSPYDPATRMVDYKGKPVSALVIDTQDSVQQNVKFFQILGQKQGAKMQLPDWGTLLDIMMPLVLLLQKLPIPYVLISHVDITEPLYAGDTLRKPGIRKFSVQGSYESQVQRWFDYILHLMPGDSDDSRKLYYATTLVNDYRITAKDRHAFFKRNNIPNGFRIDSEVGWPKTRSLTAIMEAHIY